MHKILTVASLLFFLALNESAWAIDYNRKLIIRKDYKNFTILGDVDYRNSSDDDKDLYHRHYDLGIRVPVSKSWSASFKYRNVYRKDEGEWDLFEQRPQLQLDNSINVPFAKIRTRVREEYRIKDGDDSFRTRLRFGVGMKKDLLKSKLFFRNEFFYDHEIDRYNRNRMDFGAEFPTIKRHFTPEIIYRVDNVYDEGEHRWQDGKEVIVLRLKVKY